MDVLFPGDRRIASEGVDFPESLTPFPEPVTSLYSAPTVDNRSEKIELDPQQPPQKLRPIRCNGRTFLENPNSAEAETGGSKGSMRTCHSELGFLTQLSPLKPSWVSGGAEENGGVAVAGEHVPAVGFQGLQQFTSEIKAQCIEIVAQSQLLEAELSSSSDDGGGGGDSSKPKGKHLDRKRKRKARKSIELLMESMISKVFQRQEEMHKQLIDMIEKSEQERIMREEAWKQQEMERARRYEEVRAQERSRSLALISFIQNTLGYEVPIPRSAETSSFEKDEGEAHESRDRKWDPSNKRWSQSEVQALITVRTAFDQKFVEGAKGVSIWEEIAAELLNMGFNRSAKKCKEKWENMNKYYKRSAENGRKHSENGKTRQYFHELDVLYKGGGNLNPENVSLRFKPDTGEKSNEEN